MSSGIPFLLHGFSRHQVKIRFVLVGIWNTLFGYGLFCILDTAFSAAAMAGYLAYMPALVISHVLSIINAFIFHKYITFKSAVRGLEVLLEFMRFSLTYAFSFCLSLLLMPVLVEVLHVRTKPAAGMIVMVCTVLSYLGHSRFSFSPRHWRPGRG